MSTNSSETTFAAGFREGICGNEAPSAKVGCTSMPVVCELSYGHRSEWHQGEGRHRWRRMRRDATADVRQALKDAIELAIAIQGNVAEITAESARSASHKSRAYGGLTKLADHLRAAVDALDGAS